MQSTPDIVGADSVVAIAASETRASWCQIVVKGSGVVKLGGKSVSPTEGLPIAAGENFFFPLIAMTGYRLDTVRLYVPVGATVSVAWIG